MLSNRSWLITIVIAFLLVLPEISKAQGSAHQERVCRPCDNGTCSEYRVGDQTLAAVSSDALQMCILQRSEVLRPAMLDRSSAVGQVVVKMVLNKRGRIVNAHCESGPPIAYQAVLNSLRRWKFKQVDLPRNNDGISGELKVAFDFRGSTPVH